MMAMQMIDHVRRKRLRVMSSHTETESSTMLKNMVKPLNDSTGIASLVATRQMTNTMLRPRIQ